MDEPLKLNQLQLFCSVVDNGGYTKASEHLNMTQPAVSQQVRSLERQLGTKLFVRRGNQVVPSEAGKVVYEYAQNMLRLDIRLKSAIRSLSSRTSETVVIGSNRPFGRYLLPGILVHYSREFPEVRIDVHYANSQEICEQVINNVVDMGLVAWDPSIELPQGLTARVIRNDPWCLVAASDTDWIRNHNVVSRSLVQTAPLISSTESSTNWKIIQRILNELDIGMEDYQVRLRLDDIESIKQIVLQGIGIAFLQLSAIQQELQEGRLSQFSFPKGYQPALSYIIVTKTKGHISASAAQLMNYLGGDTALG
ncbi:MAG: LysR family transcriptional regulator [Alicyclobacillus herbarius]|uniref:LysR family transcriptional regulator n=1 Tax=Alicyclobacillus herbarius TaxID=122960 RepID=UPI002354AAF6|nr:LysR family transcriptional regulator [Alicyclobacillus herbarius]MCL6633801.1 LysR family transcriptional regulator [Alicyclobacillus herbarius]